MKKRSKLLADLSNTFDSLSYDLNIEKLYAYGFDFPAPKLIQSHL